MSISAVVLFTGSLDSLLAVRLLQAQQIEVLGYCHWAICQPRAALAHEMAERLGMPLVVEQAGGDYLALLRAPAHGRGRGFNPCLDCRIHVARRGARLRETRQADFVASGEVLGQHPMTQKRRDLELVAHASGLGDRLLRPLSARLLGQTWAQRAGLIDIDRLPAFSGRGRQAQQQLARELGVAWQLDPLPGCALAEPVLGGHVRELLAREPSADSWHLATLTAGRQSMLDGATQAVLGRSARENEALERLFATAAGRAATLLVPRSFDGPSMLIVGACSAAAIDEGKRIISERARQGAYGEIDVRSSS